MLVPANASQALPSFGDEVDLGIDPEYVQFPVFIEAVQEELKSSTTAAVRWVESNMPKLDALIIDAGAVVLRGFAFADSTDFNRFIDLYPGTSFGYEGGGSPRGVAEGKALHTSYLPQI